MKKIIKKNNEFLFQMKLSTKKKKKTTPPKKKNTPQKNQKTKNNHLDKTHHPSHTYK